jgi:hypothetical protein
MGDDFEEFDLDQLLDEEQQLFEEATGPDVSGT